MTDKTEGDFDFYLEKPSRSLVPTQANFGNVLKRTTKVGSFMPNRLGLFDMHGNLWEWCDDIVPVDPKKPDGDTMRILRGGSWNDDAERCQAANRNGQVAALSFDDIGFRVARVPIADKKTSSSKFTNTLGMDFGEKKGNIVNSRTRTSH